MRRIALLLPVLALGCFRTSPSVVFHTLTPTNSAPAAPVAQCLVEIQPVRLPELLHRSQLVVRTSADSLSLLDSHRWGNALDQDLQQVLGEDLGALLGGGSVVRYPHGEGARAKYRLNLEVHRLDGQPGGSLQFRGTWSLARREDGQVVLRRDFAIQEPVAGREVEGLVAAHNRAVAVLAQALAADLKALKGE
jgi:uncharacterized lipoprotein YmbA